MNFYQNNNSDQNNDRKERLRQRLEEYNRYMEEDRQKQYEEWQREQENSHSKDAVFLGSMIMSGLTLAIFWSIACELLARGIAGNYYWVLALGAPMLWFFRGKENGIRKGGTRLLGDKEINDRQILVFREILVFLLVLIFCAIRGLELKKAIFATLPLIAYLIGYVIADKKRKEIYGE